ncbi:hypothetical protein [Galbibacter sp. BG1]
MQVRVLSPERVYNNNIYSLNIKTNRMTNKEKLLKDVSFPLKWENDNSKIYICDSSNSVVADVDSDNLDADNHGHPFESLIGEFKEVSEPDNNRYFFDQITGDFYDRRKGVRIGSVRGWSKWEDKYGVKAIEHQNIVANYIMNIINQ